MKKICLFLFFILFLLETSSAQTLRPNPILTFDGINDYVDLGPSVGNGIRTIEFWFRPKNLMNSSTITEQTALVVRNNGLTLNEHEFTVYFSPVNGKINFDLEDHLGNIYHVFSNSTSWNAGQWYHVAAVVDASLGMMLFIDGIKQTQTNPYAQATGTINKITTVARWGDLSIRYFAGSINDLRFSTDAIYTNNFIPPCPDLKATTSTKALWNFNEGIGSIATDSSFNSFNGQTVGAVWDTTTICPDTTNIEDDPNETISNLLNIYPNPSDGYFYFELLNQNITNSNLLIYNSLGQIVLEQKHDGYFFELNLKHVAAGIYYYRLIDSNNNTFVGKIVKY